MAKDAVKRICHCEGAQFATAAIPFTSIREIASPKTLAMTVRKGLTI
jgi:hypothetical protein